MGGRELEATSAPHSTFEDRDRPITTTQRPRATTERPTKPPSPERRRPDEARSERAARPRDPTDQMLSAWYATAYRVAFRVLGDRDHAHDVAQDTMERALRHWPRIESYADGWIVRVSSNRAIDVHRRAGRQGQLLTRLAGRPQPRPSDDPHASERADLVEALRRLSPRQREVVVLRYLADFSEDQVARMLDCSPGTVKQHAHRGISTLRTLLEAANREPAPRSSASSSLPSNGNDDNRAARRGAARRRTPAPPPDSIFATAPID